MRLGLGFRVNVRFSAFQQVARAGGGHKLQSFRGLFPPKL